MLPIPKSAGIIMITVLELHSEGSQECVLLLFFQELCTFHTCKKYSVKIVKEHFSCCVLRDCGKLTITY